MRARWAVVFFDLDGTLLPGTSVSVLTADWLGRGGALDELEGRYHDGLIEGAVVAETRASWFAGGTLAEVNEVLERAPWIAGIPETVADLHAAGACVALATVTWRFAAELVAASFGFEMCCGTEMAIVDGCLSGAVSGRYSRPIGCGTDGRARTRVRCLRDTCGLAVRGCRGVSR